MPSPSECRWPGPPGSAGAPPPGPGAPAGGAPRDGGASAPPGDGGGGEDAVPPPPSARRPRGSGARPEAPAGTAERSEPEGSLAEGARRASGAPPRGHRGHRGSTRPARPPAPTTPGAPRKGALPLVGAVRPCAGFLVGVVLLFSGDGADGGRRPAGWPSAVRRPSVPTSATGSVPPAGARAAPEGCPRRSPRPPCPGGQAAPLVPRRGPRGPNGRTSPHGPGPYR
jgi:hypothetical protein